MKLCIKCKQNKDLDDFCKDKACKDGYRNVCKKCYNKQKRKNYNPKANKKKYQANKDKILSDRKKYYIKNRKTA